MFCVWGRGGGGGGRERLQRGEGEMFTYCHFIFYHKVENSKHCIILKVSTFFFTYTKSIIEKQNIHIQF